MTATRRFAAILAADVAGYSRLMGAGEARRRGRARSFPADSSLTAIGRIRGLGKASEPERGSGVGDVRWELVDNKVPLKGVYSEVDQPAVRSIGKRTPDHWSERVSLTAVLFVSLGLWAAIWEAVGWLASAVWR